MVRLLLALCLVLCGTAAHAADAWSWVDGVTVAAAPPVTVAKPACACGDSCQCAGELVELRAYRDKMEQYLIRYAGHTLPYRTVSTTSVVQQTSPVVTYTYADEDPVCVDGKCFSPSTSTPYTGGAYTRWMGNSYATPSYRPRVFGFKRVRGGFGGSCADGMCQ